MEGDGHPPTGSSGDGRAQAGAEPEADPGAGPEAEPGPGGKRAPGQSRPEGRSGPEGRSTELSRLEAIAHQVRRMVTAIRNNDETMVENAVLSLSQRSRWLAPLALVVGAFAMLFQGLKLLVTNWRLTLVEILPAMWIWAAMLDLKLHAFRGKEFHIIRGPLLIPILLVIAVITAASFYLNAVFAFAIAKPGTPQIRPAFAQARRHLPTDPVVGLRPSGSPCGSPPSWSNGGARAGTPSP